MILLRISRGRPRSESCDFDGGDMFVVVDDKVGNDLQKAREAFGKG